MRINTCAFIALLALVFALTQKEPNDCQTKVLFKLNTTQILNELKPIHAQWSNKLKVSLSHDIFFSLPSFLS